ncbi:MAG: cation transporter [Paludibacteraceae bacterium]|nr:cation transporter [Paludibacteraceae bacterium]
MQQGERYKEIRNVTLIGFVVNLLLTLTKLFAGIVGKSSAMIADGVHSLSDFATDIVVIVFMRVSDKESDENHKYGHGKFETFAILIISICLFVVGIGLLIGGIDKIVYFYKGNEIMQPSLLAFYAALVSIALKEALFWYTFKIGKKVNSDAVIANAWHHRSDAFSSIATALGIAGAIFLGEKFRILDPIASVLVSFFIMKVSYELAMPSVKELLESSLPKEKEDEIIDHVLSIPGVITYHHLRTRKVGNLIAIDIHIKLNKHISFVESHDIATDVESLLRHQYGNQTVVNIHTEPYEEKK